MMIKTFLLLASALAISYLGFSQTTSPQQRDTVETGALYLTDPMTFKTETGYVKRVVVSEWTYKRRPDTSPLADSVTYVKVKEPKAVSYYLVKSVQGKETWVKVQVISDYDINLKLK